MSERGLVETVLNAIEEALAVHELIKVKVGKTSAVELKALSNELTEKVPCELAQSIGKTLLLYMVKDEDPKIVLPD